MGISKEPRQIPQIFLRESYRESARITARIVGARCTLHPVRKELAMHQPPRRSPLAARRHAESAMLGFALACVLWTWVPKATAQWTITYDVNEDMANAALPADRVGPMNQALERVKARIESILNNSTGSALFLVEWTQPESPGAVADASNFVLHALDVTAARDKIVNRASLDDESPLELALLEAIPNAGGLTFYHDGDTLHTASTIRIPSSLNKHLTFAGTTSPNDGTLRFRPPGPFPSPNNPNRMLKWQFWPSRGNNSLTGHEVFEAVVFHETLHALGFRSEADNTTTPTTLSSWDIFRLPDTSIPVSSNNFTTTPRELRQTVEATAVTALNSSSKAYKLSRGARTGGDGFQASHWRSYGRLDPEVPIGMMDPTSSRELYLSLNRRYYSRADVEALDVMGWNVDPNSVTYNAAAVPQLTSPALAAQFAFGDPITFEWVDTGSTYYTLMIHPGTEVLDDNPVRVFYQMPAGTTSVVLPGADSLPPGEYVWGVVASTLAGDSSSEDRRLTILPACDSLDFNNDTFSPDSGDLDDFIGVFGGGPSACSTFPTPGCNDLDFNNDGFSPDSLDIDAFISRLGGGPCLQ